MINITKMNVSSNYSLYNQGNSNNGYPGAMTATSGNSLANTIALSEEAQALQGGGGSGNDEQAISGLAQQYQGLAPTSSSGQAAPSDPNDAQLQQLAQSVLQAQQSSQNGSSTASAPNDSDQVQQLNSTATNLASQGYKPSQSTEQLVTQALGGQDPFQQSQPAQQSQATKPSQTASTTQSNTQNSQNQGTGQNANGSTSNGAATPAQNTAQTTNQVASADPSGGGDAQSQTISA